MYSKIQLIKLQVINTSTKFSIFDSTDIDYIKHYQLQVCYNDKSIIPWLRTLHTNINFKFTSTTAACSFWFLLPKTEKKYPGLHYCRNVVLRILWQSFTIGGSDSRDILGQDMPQAKDQSRHGFKDSRHQRESMAQKDGVLIGEMMSQNVARLALTRKTGTRGRVVFGVAWCCQPHWMEHRYQPNLKRIWMDG